LNSIFNWLIILKDYTPKTKEVILSALTQWFEVLMKELMKPDSKERILPTKLVIFQILTTCFTNFPDYFKGTMSQIIPIIWDNFVNCATIWEQLCDEEDDDSAGYDSDTGDSYDHKHYMCLTIHLLTQIV